MITLYTAPTPNGHKVSIALEELGLPYEVRALDLGALEQREPWFLALNPNGRIPVIVDHDADELVVFESGAILLHLAERAGLLIGDDARRRSETIQWLMFQMSAIGPMMGQANVFARYAPEPIPYAIERYRRECRRLFEVLERRLDGREWLAADRYTIADIASFAWVRTHRWSGLDVEGLPRLSDWLARIAARPAVARGLAVPPRAARSAAELEASARKMLA